MRRSIPIGVTGLVTVLALLVGVAAAGRATALPASPRAGATVSDVVPVASAKRGNARSGNKVVEARRKARAERKAERLAAKGKRRRPTTPAVAAAPPPPVMSRAEILATDPVILERIGRHVMIGYHNAADVRALLERRAIAGVFITDHNALRRKAEVIKSEIDGFQEFRRQQGLPPLIVAADQEGGAVSRLTPPLKAQPSLGDIVRRAPDDAERKKRVEAYARLQAEELKRLGVTLNFSPVVDLRLDPKRRTDGQTQLRLRAISEDPHLVARVAGWYCATLAEQGLTCTLKHFPGLGRVSNDTHRSAGTIAVSSRELLTHDWVPFTELMHRKNVATMLAHVKLPDLDPDNAASYSRVVVQDVVRGDLALAGVLITDDLSMGAITRSPDGLGGAAVKSLEAGVDMLLVSYSERDLDSVMTGLIAAAKAGKLDTDRQKSSADRLVEFARMSEQKHDMRSTAGTSGARALGDPVPSPPSPRAALAGEAPVAR